MKYSIIIPTYNEREMLEKCLQGIKNYTDLSDAEVIVVCNGCKDGSPELVKTFGEKFKCMFWPEPLGFAKAVNVGFACSTGDYIVMLNNDSYLLGQGWLEMLEQPFKDFPKVGISGPALQHVKNKEGKLFGNIIFFCAMIKREVIKTIGYLDESFGIGEGEDFDFSIRTQLAGFELIQVPYNTSLAYDNKSGLISGGFPIYHQSFQTRKKISNIREVMSKNNVLLSKRYNIDFN
jgi:GT2 family glycosyltransferase